MKNILSAFVVVLLLIYGCLGSEKPYSPPSGESLILKLCVDKVWNINEFISPYDANHTIQKITSVDIYMQNGQTYFGAGGWSGGYSGATDIYDSDGQFVMKLQWDDVSNNNDPCYNKSGARVTCPTFVKDVTCTNNMVTQPVPPSVLSKYDQLRAGHNGPAIFTCTKENNTIYRLQDTPAGGDSTWYFYDAAGNFLETYRYSAFYPGYTPDGPEPHTDVSDYDCKIVRQWNTDNTSIMSSPHHVFNAVNKTIVGVSDKIYYSNGTKIQIDNECNSELVKEIMNQSEIGDAIHWLNKVGKDPAAIKVLSWWDYGSSLDCNGLQSVISGKNLDDPKILEIAHVFISGNESDLISFMKANNIKYVMIPSELLGPSYSLGEGKYSALNYLSCVRDNRTDVAARPVTSVCEAEYGYSQNKNSAFYKSILYKAVVSNELIGLDEVYSDSTGSVKIFELNAEYIE